MRPFAAILILSWATGVRAQMLDLGERPARPDSSVAATALRDRLDSEIATHLQRHSRDLARQAVRSLARHLVQRGLDARDRGAIHLLLAQTLALDLQSLDEIINDPSLISDAEISLLLHDLDITDRDLSIEPADLDRLLNDVFAQVLANLPATHSAHAWLEPPPVDPADALTDAWLDEIVRLGVSEEGAAGVLVIRDDLRDALRWTAYAPAASRIARTIQGAVGVLDPAYAWITPVYREAMLRDLDQSLQDLALDYKRADALRSLERWRIAARAFELADQLPAGPYARQAQDALVMVASSTNADLPGPRRRMADFTRVLALLQDGESLPGEDALVRPFRPIHRVASDELDRSSERLVRSLATILERDDAMTNPGVLAAISAHRSAVEDLRAIVIISDAFTDPALGPGMIRVDRRLLADQLMRTLRTTEDPQIALGVTRDMAAQLERYERLPGEAALRDAVTRAGAGTLTGVAQIWADATGFRQNELLAMIERERQAWWAQWSRDFEIQDHPTEFHTLDALRMLVETIAWAQIVNAAAFSAAPNGPVDTPLQAWPGFEMSADALKAIAPAPGIFSEAARLVVADRPGDAMDELRAIIDQHPAFIAVARLELEAARRGATRPTVLHELGTGGPPPAWHADQAWMADRRFEIAELCRYAEELAALESLNDRARAETVRAYVNDIARLIIRDLDTKSR